MAMMSLGGVALVCVFFLHYRDRMIHWGVANNCLIWEGVWEWSLRGGGGGALRQVSFFSSRERVGRRGWMDGRLHFGETKGGDD